MHSHDVCLQITFQTKWFRTDVATEAFDIQVRLVVSFPRAPALPLQFPVTLDTPENVPDIRIRPSVHNLGGIYLGYRRGLIILNDHLSFKLLLVHTSDVCLKVTFQTEALLTHVTSVVFDVRMALPMRSPSRLVLRVLFSRTRPAYQD